MDNLNNKYGGLKLDDLKHFKFNCRVELDGGFIKFINSELVTSDIVLHFVHERCFDTKTK